jgi:predicted anti-sigma-YlaC factor YlaD
MNCKKAGVLMSASVDGELSLNEEQDFLEHLSECQECRAEFEDAKKTKLIIKEKIIQFKAPEALMMSIMQLTSFSAKEHEGTTIYE